MKRTLLILVFGLIAAAAAYGCIYFACTSSVRSLQDTEQPELAWLRDEFNLNDAEFKRVSELHAEYLPQCREMCLQVDSQHEKLQNLLSATRTMTPEIEASLAESGRLRSECQRMMLRHFLQVSQTMPVEQGRRYLLWVTRKAFAPNFDMTL